MILQLSQTCGGKCNSLDNCVKCYLIEKGDAKLKQMDIDCNGWSEWRKCRDISIAIRKGND